MTTMSVIEALEAVEKAAAKNGQKLKTCRKVKMSVGDVIRQGDIYLTFLGTSFRGLKERALRGTNQVALGTNEGARHIASGAGVATYTVSFAAVRRLKALSGSGSGAGGGIRLFEQQLGPLVVSTGDWNLLHPQHDDFELTRGYYLVTYQFDPRTMRAVQD